MATNKIKTFVVRGADGSVSDELPLGVDAINVDLSNGQTLEEVIGEYDSSKGSVEKRLTDLENIDEIKYEMTLGYEVYFPIPSDKEVYLFNIYNGAIIGLLTSKLSKILLDDGSITHTENFQNDYVVFSTVSTKKIPIIFKKII